MEIIALNSSLLQFATVDEDESEAVAISCVEFLLSETNVFYNQQVLSRKTLQMVSFRLKENILDTVFAATLEAPDSLNYDRFQPELRPEAEPKDRHAVRSVPSKSPENLIFTKNSIPLKNSSSQASRVGSNSEKLRLRPGKSTQRRRKMTEPDNTCITIQTIEIEATDIEKPEVKAWRDKCLKSLEASTRKPGFSKWVALARVFSVPATRISMEVGIIAAPPPNIVAALAATPIQMKTNVDSFSSISDLEVSEETENSTFTKRNSHRSSNFTGRSLQPMAASIYGISENVQHQSKRRSQSANVSDVTLQQRKSTLITDSLSRRKLSRKYSTESLSGANSMNGWNSSRSIWRNEAEAGNATSRTFVADESEFSTANLSTTMSVASGVILQQGENVVQGPEWVDNATTMSRKRFDLQQRLATDALFNSSSERDLSPRSLILGSPLQFGHPSSPLLELHFRDYQEVPAEPIPIPQLSPISTSTLAIPRTHLTSSLSPSLRVRSSASSGKSITSSVNNDTNGSNRSIGTNSSSQSSLKSRPTTALRAISGTSTLVSSRIRATSAPRTKHTDNVSAKYLREFPKPKPGVVRVINGQAIGLLGSVDDGQRTAWMS